MVEVETVLLEGEAPLDRVGIEFNAFTCHAKNPAIAEVFSAATLGFSMCLKERR